MGEGKEFIGKSISETLAQGSSYYNVAEERLKFSILEEKRDPQTGDVVEVRVWIDRPEPSAVRHVARADEGSLESLRSVVMEILRIANLDLTVTVNELDDYFEIELAGQDKEFVLDKHGDFLNALQYVIGKIVSKRYKISKKIIVDSDGFREKRSSELIEIALHAAERVRRVGENYEFGPLTPYERRLIHVALGNVPGVKTFSTGEGFKKKLIIAPAEKE